MQMFNQNLRKVNSKAESQDVFIATTPELNSL